MKLETPAFARLLHASLFAVGMCGVFVLAGAGSGKLDVTVILPIVLALLSLFLTRADQHYRGPAWLLRSFAFCGLLEMPLLPLLVATDNPGLVVDGVLPGIVRMLLLAQFCMVALSSRKTTSGVRA